MTIKLRDRRTGKEVNATAEKTCHIGTIDTDEMMGLLRPGSTGRFQFEWGPMEYHDGEGSETVVDSWGDRVFLTAEGMEEVPERFLEPFCDNMSARVFRKTRVYLEFAAADPALVTNVQELLSTIDDNALPGSGIYMRQHVEDGEPINATEMAMFLRDIEVPTAVVGLWPDGRDDGSKISTPEPVATVEEEPSPSHWDDRPGHPVEDWKYEIQNGDTRQGYTDWCDGREEEAAAAGQLLCPECGGMNPPGAECTSDFCLRARGEEDSQGQENCRTCEEPYNCYGDGHDGECPDCADKSAARDEEHESHGSNMQEIRNKCNEEGVDYE